MPPPSWPAQAPDSIFMVLYCFFIFSVMLYILPFHFCYIHSNHNKAVHTFMFVLLYTFIFMLSTLAIPTPGT